MKRLITAAAILCMMEAYAMADKASFVNDTVGATPKGWTATMTGPGQSKWTVEEDSTAPSKSKVVKQSGRAAYPLLLKNGTSVTDGFVEVQFKAVSGTEDRAAALAKVRKGDADVAVEMQGKTLVAHYTQTDQVQAAITQGMLRAFVDGANVEASGRPPVFDFRAERVEDSSLQVIQFVTPGLLGWAVAMSAAFGAAATLQGWRQSKLLRRLQLSPVSTNTLVGARVSVTVGVALTQMAIFLGLGVAAFGLRLTGAWPVR